jgi:hypothetical protein
MNSVPTAVKDLRHLLPGQSLCPIRQKPFIDGCGFLLSYCPGNLFDPDSTTGTVDPTHAVQQKDSITPEWNKLKSSFGLGVISWTYLPTLGADALTPFSGMHFHLQAGVAFPGTETDFSINKALDLMHPIEDRLKQHPFSFLG